MNMETGEDIVMNEIMAFSVCEDNEKDRVKLLSYITRYAQENGLNSVRPLSFSHTRELLTSDKTYKASALFLDIMMPGDSGMEPFGITTARMLRKKGYEGAIVFITASDEYYSEGFEVAATHYLVKPFAYGQFCEAMRRILKKTKPPERFISVPFNRALTRIPLSGLIYAEVYGHQTLLHTVVGTHATTLPLNEVEYMLDGTPFLRCYRSYIVNMDHIKRIEEGGFLMDDSSRVPISQRDAQKIREQYLAHCFSRMRKED